MKFDEKILMWAPLMPSTLFDKVQKFSPFLMDYIIHFFYFFSTSYHGPINNIWTYLGLELLQC